MKRMTGTLSRLFRWVLQPLLVAAILVVGFLGARGLSSRREPPSRADAPLYAPLVRVIETRPVSTSVEVRGHGALRARTRVDLVPQVAGEVIAIHPGLRPGGRFGAEETLLEIEPRDYELAVERAHAEVLSADSSLATLGAEAASAREEWRRLEPDLPVPPLVALEPQTRAAEARLAAARAALEQAELDLARTKVSLPYGGRVVAANVDVGEVVARNQSIGTVYATDVFEVTVPLHQEELRWIVLPGETGGGGTSVDLRADVAGRTVDLEGRVVRLEAELDSRSRLARVVVEVGLAGLDEDVATRLLPGLFLDAVFHGEPLVDVVALPRAAVHANGVVWVVEGDRLRFVAPEVRHRTDGEVLVAGLAPGARVVVSDLEVVTDGMSVRTVPGSEAAGEVPR